MRFYGFSRGTGRRIFALALLSILLFPGGIQAREEGISEITFYVY